MDFVIYYEHENRELENCVLLQHELIRRGYSAVVVKNTSYKALLYKTLIKPKVILIPYCYTEELLKGFLPYNNKGIIKVVNLQLEQVLSDAWEELGFHNPKGAAKEVYHLSWGRKTYERLMLNGVEESNILMTGAIHLDFLKPKFNNYYYSKQEISNKYNVPYNKKWILYISSFSYTSIKGNTSLNNLKENISKGTNKEKSVELVDTMFDISKKSKEKTIEWIEKLLSDEDLIFIYRPHPAESLNSFDIENLKKKYPTKFFCIADLSIRQWIHSADLLTTWFSTSIVEAYFAKKQCYILRPYDFPREMESVVYKGGKIVNSYNKLYNIVKTFSPSFNKDEFSISEEVISGYYGELTTELNCMKLSDSLESIIGSMECNVKIENNVSKKYYIGKIIQYLLSLFYIKTKINIGMLLSRKIFARLDRDAELSIEKQGEILFNKIKNVRYWINE